MIRHGNAVIDLVTWVEFTFCNIGDTKNDFFIVNFEHGLQIVLVFPSLT